MSERFKEIVNEYDNECFDLRCELNKLASHHIALVAQYGNIFHLRAQVYRFAKGAHASPEVLLGIDKGLEAFKAEMSKRSQDRQEVLHD